MTAICSNNNSNFQATFDDANKMCGERNMNLISFEKLAESDLVSDFISELG
jgi:hypothetical protein